MFIATANDLSTIAGPLRDRMEIIEVTGYLMEEKREIAKRHLIPKQLENHGITAGHVTIPDEIIDLIIEKYTRESGVRSLDMTIAKIMRHVARKVAMNKKFTITLDENKVKEYLGSPIFSREEYQGNELPGVVTGLAWTAVGGEILYIESSYSKGKMCIRDRNTIPPSPESISKRIAYVTLSESLLYRQAVTSVSYTHLDVYKRQLLTQQLF